MLIIFIYLNIEIAKAEETNPLLTMICLKQFQNEMEDANIKPPEQMGKYTCDCFLSKVNENFSISTATKICKDMASKEFKHLISSPQNHMKK